MSDRYVVTSRAGEPILRTNDRASADHWQTFLGGDVIDREATS